MILRSVVVLEVVWQIDRVEEATVLQVSLEVIHPTLDVQVAVNRPHVLAELSNLHLGPWKAHVEVSVPLALRTDSPVDSHLELSIKPSCWLKLLLRIRGKGNRVV